MKQKNVRISIFLLMIVLLILPEITLAGDLDPPAPPGPTMHTLNEIYNAVSAISSGSGELAPVAKTGQTISDATGDDGDLQKGVSHPNPRFTDNSDGTVTDNLTGLIWQKDGNCDGTMTWIDAVSYGNSLEDGICGLTDGSSAGDWRLPNVRELVSLVDFGTYSPPIPAGHPFTNTQFSYYWSSTSYAVSTNGAWSVDFFYGNVYGTYKTNSYYVRAVRGGQ